MNTEFETKEEKLVPNDKPYPFQLDVKMSNNEKILQIADALCKTLSAEQTKELCAHLIINLEIYYHAKSQNALQQS